MGVVLSSSLSFIWVCGSRPGGCGHGKGQGENRQAAGSASQEPRLRSQPVAWGRGGNCCCHVSEVRASDRTLGQGHRAVNPKSVESQERAVCFVGSEGTGGSSTVMGQGKDCCTL